MASYDGLEGILTGLTKSTDRPSRAFRDAAADRRESFNKRQSIHAPLWGRRVSQGCFGLKKAS